MKDLEITEGDWKVDIDHQTHQTGKITIATGNLSTGYNWQIIAEVEKNDNTLPNAKLIASAPELLEALQRLVKTVESEGLQRDILLDRAEQAIKKATE